MNTEPTRIVAHIEGTMRLTTSELWPNGDAPSPLTASVVIDRLLDDDNLRDRLLDGITVQVDVDAPYPAWSQDETLLPGYTPSRRLRTGWSFDL